jgi:PAS domain-containing protein
VLAGTHLYGGGRPLEFLVTSADGGTVLMRSIDPARWIGKPVAGTPFAGTTGVERRDVDGKSRLYEQTTVPGVGWKFLAGEDKAAALAAGNHLRQRQLVIILAGLALVLLVTFAVYRRVAVPIRRRGAAVRSTGAQTTHVPVPVSGPAEVTELGDDINGVISSVSRELLERRRMEETALASERSYRQLFESSPVPMWIHDAGTLAILELNDAAVARYGYTHEEFLALTMTDIVVPGARADEARCPRSRGIWPRTAPRSRCIRSPTPYCSTAARRAAWSRRTSARASGSRPGSVRPRRWRRWASSPAEWRTTSTTC